MNFEVLKESNWKRNVFIGVVIVAVISTVVLQFTKAKYRTAESMPLINGTVNYNLADLNVVAVYLQDEKVEDGYIKADTIPTKGYIFNEEISYCSIDNVRDDSITISYDMNTQTLNIVPLTSKGTKCYLYFDEEVSIKDTLLAYYPTVRTRTDFSTTVTDTTTGVIYKSADSSQYDNDGEVYYFAGNPTDNWVSFAGFYWRIIRINGDGSLRLIYQGTSANTTGEGTQIGTSVYNNSSNLSEYVGLKYTQGSQHGTNTNSTIMTKLNDWYYDNLRNYADDIDTNAGFCNDRETRNGYSWTSQPSNIMFYKTHERLNVNKNPSFKCTNKNSDLFTISSSNKGNKSLQYPIGLITADEIIYAGGLTGSSNSSYYLYTGQPYWTISPYDFYAFGSINCARVYSVNQFHSLGNFCVEDWIEPGIRPVINLNPDVKISSGDGSSQNPYVIQTM